ncbi:MULTISPECIES: L-2-amino-thiazoline-4-carboxylic acid hydrolase [unclassified Crossiella]|uniref:L-2-amino-thiazoline-4-carboxylic acid hydrolase n=1 Tax=unclassified Crossiella TaxID=2620835 RepID=UPI0020002B4E|nr:MULTISPECIES: L-2-amino-thiazoline-4-carboxylic acid hydrolase [unclassified Crossiella]MCK2238685.1 L-2-amino-thiazoline-4-carboxylic acid hydrolase [Crossiella sp. S99.2]MCK2251745.1 L-2-amino-thiazoline-4-carboxylic acid hydrolase [Crossiella sp. S99.1]
MSTNQFDSLDAAYVPNPAVEIPPLIEAFLTWLAERVPGFDPAATRALGAELAAAQSHRIVDEAARHNLALTTMVVAAFRLLPGEIDRHTLVRRALAEPLAEQIAQGTRYALDYAEDAFSTMVAISKAREEHAFGAGFAFHRAADDDREYLLEVRQCFYHEVLKAHDAAELTPALCAFDESWIGAIDPDRHGLTFERSTTLGLGGTHCPFSFRRS